MPLRSTCCKAGDPCPRSACTGRLGVYATKVLEEEGIRVRYLHCKKCRCRPAENQQVLPLEYAPPRR